ncbi:MAG TPA: class IV adenylate cyclase [Ferruginibacter sp.]|mgnify:CR=1 FL=1|nr:class IV adenylate cyclase [Ferruginibacter sp.]HMP19974.1 class IV adenylate cyclase [Ferruginibacter sp.]
MPILNIEFKARCADIDKAEKVLLKLQPRYTGTDLQADTYFNVPNGRLKLREGNIENALIHYKRENNPGSRQSKVMLYRHQPGSNLKEMLAVALGIKVVVEKQRKIYFAGNVKFHFDTVKNLGTFIEVEAIDADGSIGVEKLHEQCRYYAQLFEVSEADYISGSYSDMLMEQTKN